MKFLLMGEIKSDKSCCVKKERKGRAEVKGKTVVLSVLKRESKFIWLLPEVSC